MLKLPVAVVQGAAAVRQPAHDQLVPADKLHAIDTEILPRFMRTARDHQRPGQQRTRVPRPAGLDGQLIEVHLVTLAQVGATHRVAHQLGPHVQHLAQQRRLVPGVFQALGGIGLTQVGQQLADFTQGRDILGAHAQSDTLRRAEQIGQYRHAVAARVFKQQGGTTGAQGAIGDLGHFQTRIDLAPDAHQLAAGLERGDKIAQIAVARTHGAEYDPRGA